MIKEKYFDSFFVFIKLNTLMVQIQFDQARQSYKKVDELISTNIFNIRGDHEQLSSRPDDRFVHFQLLIDCLCRFKSASTDKIELTIHFEKENLSQTSIIDEFELNYSFNRGFTDASR
jgi:hypothetical protein